MLDKSKELAVKKPVAVYCIADKNNIPYARTMIKSLKYFHKDWDVILYTNETDKEKLPEGVILKDLSKYLVDTMFFYRATPILAEELLNEYECVIKIDADSLILGDLSILLETKDFDVATVINWNRFDEKFYPLVQGWGIFPAEYFNCGFVVMRSRQFAHDWRMLCYTPQFDRLQFKEQDLLNALCYFGNYNVRCLDFGNKDLELNSWWGIIGKGEWNRAIVDKEKRIVIPKGLGDTPFPPTNIEIKVAHMGGGNGAPKDNWNALFSEQAMNRIQEILA